MTTEHPLFRVHPVSGWKSLYFNSGFFTKIVGVPKLESDMIIRHLNEVIATTQELHCCFQWGKHDVAIWDNSVKNHTASYGFAPHRRYAVRVAVQAEKPYFHQNGKSQEEVFNMNYDLLQVNKNDAGQSNYND